MPKENKIRILYVQPGKYPEERIIDNTLKAYQSLVYGDIESVAPWRTNVRVVCNQEGKLNGMPPNRLLGDYDILMGSFFICGLRNGNFISLTDEQFKRYEKLYHDPIIFTDAIQLVTVTPIGNFAEIIRTGWCNIYAITAPGNAAHIVGAVDCKRCIHRAP